MRIIFPKTNTLCLTEFEHTDNGGTNACQFLSYFYLVDGSGTGFIWFGVPLFDDRYTVPSGFTVDTGTGLYIYGMSLSAVYKNTLKTGRRSFFNSRATQVVTSDKWMHLRFDIKPYMESCIKDALSKYNVYPDSDSLDDFYFSGMNLGYEVHGTYNTTFEIKNLSLTFITEE